MTFLRLMLGYLLQTLPFAFLCIYPFRDALRLPGKKAWGATALLLAALGLLFAYAGCYLKGIFPPGQALFQAANAWFLFLLLPCGAWFFILVRAGWQRKLFLLCFALTSAMLITAVCNLICSNFPWSLPDDGLPYRIDAFLVLLLLTALALPALWLLVERGYRPMADSLSSREHTVLSLLCLGLFVFLAGGFSFLDYEHLDRPVMLFLFAALVVCLCVLYGICFRMLLLSHRQLRAQREIRQARQAFSLQQEQYRRIRDSVRQTRQMRHDLRHHMVTIQGYLQRGDLQAASDYIARYLEQAQRYAVTQLCEHPIVNTLISHYQALAEEAGIAFSASVRLGAALGVAPEDMAVLLGNLLDNALEAAGRQSTVARFIRVGLYASGQMLAITVDNSFDGTVRMAEGRYLSTKALHDGLGLESIAHIAARYEGGVEFSHEKQVFHASVMLAAQQAPSG